MKRLTTMSDKWGDTAKYYPPVSAAQLESAEKQIGFQLPPLIREIYLQVGNGGFGPDYGIIGLEGGHLSFKRHLVKSYFDFQSVESYLLSAGDYPEYLEWTWEKSYLAYNHRGCNIHTVVDCASPHLQIYLLDDFTLKPDPAQTLHQWWLDWLNGSIQQY